MKKIALLATALIFSFSFQSLYAKAQFNNDQLRQFHETNRCPNCDLSGFEFQKDDLNHSGALLHSANLSNALGEIWPGVNFAFADMVNANLAGAILPHANFSNANLSGAHFDGADLTGANFFEATGFNPNNANVCGAILPDGSKGACEK